MDKRPFFFQHTLGFRRNPFGALNQAEWADVALFTPAVESCLASSIPHIQLLGPMGSGKTTTLLKLADHFSSMKNNLAYEYLAHGERSYKTDAARLDMFLLDEAQRLSRRARRRLLGTILAHSQRGLRLIFSSHADLTALFRRRGLPLLTVDLAGVLTPGLYGQMLARRLDYFALPHAAHTTLSADAVQWLYNQFYPNVRDGEYFLYEVWQRETAVREVTAVHLKNLFTEMA